ncbi:MAG: hypothetical protein NTX08_07205 [Sphingobacteriales bacterium]|nr:hypothetical protein [Sphingobacteriales bacterium]
MRFFSKLTVLCNCCFLVALVLWWMEFHKKRVGHDERIIPLPWAESTLVTLGYGAIIVNVLFLLICLIMGAFKQKLNVPKWMIVFCVLIFFGQIYFFFFQ